MSNDERQAKIWVAVNHNCRALTKESQTYDEATKELEEYSFQTGNTGAVLRNDDDEIIW